MITDDLRTEPNDRLETEPADLGPYLVRVLNSTLAKRVAADAGKLWSPVQETGLQEAIAELIAAAKSRSLASFDIVVVKATGQRVVRSLDLARLSRERKLQ